MESVAADTYEPIKILDDVKSIQAGQDSNTIFAIRLDNSLYAWGEEGFYTEEQGWIEEAGSPYKVMDNVKLAVPDGEQAFIIKTDDSLWSWGYSYQGNRVENE